VTVERAPVRAHGIAVKPPAGIDVRIRRRRPDGPAVASDGGTGVVDPSGEVFRPVVHLSTRPLTEERGDFGGGFVEGLGARDALVCLIELDPSTAGSAMVGDRPLPDRLTAADFHPDTMQRTIAGQAGAQVFCTAAGRAFCLYVVLGSYRARHEVLPVVNRMLAAIAVEPV
jgi:hypothetical protein